MWVELNNNPLSRRVGDCAVRAVAMALGVDWETAYIMLAANGYAMGDVISSDSVWGSTLRQHGFYREIIPDECPDCYTAEDFCNDHPDGVYVLGFGGHVATVIDGNLTSTAIVTVPKGCCFTLAVEYVDGTTDDPATVPTPTISVQNGNLTITRIA